MTYVTTTDTWISYFQALLGSILCCTSMSGLNQLDNFINCWFHFMDQSNHLSNNSYTDICKNAASLAEKGVLEPYAFKWSMLTSLMYIASFFGAMMFPVSDKYGRKALITISCVFCIIGTACQAISFYFESYLLMEIGSLFVGLNGGSTVMIYPVYFVEIAPDSKKGLFGASFMLGCNIGTSFALFVGLEWILGKVDTWPWAIAVQIPFNFLHLVLIYFSVESPTWLESVKTGSKPKEATMTKIKKLWSDPKLRAPLITSLTIRGFQLTSGVVAFTLFSLTILQNIGVPTSVAVIVGLAISISSIFSSSLAGKMINSFGIRKSYLISAFGAFISVITFFILHSFAGDNETLGYASVGALAVYAIFVNLGIMPIPFMLPAMWLPDEYKSVTTGLIAMFGFVLNVPFYYLLPFTLYKIKAYTFLIFACSIGASFLCGYFKIVERADI